MSAQQQAAKPTLTWPPTKEDLQRLYVDEKLSAAKIAKAYSRETANPKSAAELIGYYLRKYGIGRRNRIEELRKETEAAVAAWKAKHPKRESGELARPVGAEPGRQGDEAVRLAEEESAVLELLRTPNLSIEHLDPPTKEMVRLYILKKHIEQGVSLGDIAKLIGNKTSGYTSWLTRQLGIQPRAFEEARLNGIHEKVRKYERRPFEGTDEEKAYMLGLKHGDLHAYNPFGDAVRVSTSTTHPALANLFTDLFSQYGHVDRHPRYKKDTGTYEWNFQAILDKSFEFLLEPRDRCREWVLSKESTMLAYLAGLIDAEGHIRPHANPKTVGIEVSIWNTDIGLLEFAYKCLKQLGYMPLEPYLSQPPGGVSSGFHIARKKAEWRVLLARFEETQSLLRRLPLKHHEKVALKEVALSVAKGDLFEKIAERLSFLKKVFRDETDRYTKQAEAEFLERHPDFRRSPPVLCTLWMGSWNHASEEIHEKILKSLGGCLAAHEDFLCWDDEPCVVICKGCNSSNIVSILVHESIHHALLWLGDEPFELEDPLDDIVPYLHEKGITEQGFEFYG